MESVAFKCLPQDTTDETLFELIAHDIEAQGYSVRPNALPEDISSALFSHQQSLNANTYIRAGVGRGGDHLKSASLRRDQICWISNDSDAGCKWIDWTSRLQIFLNQRLFLGLFSFESHFAHYSPGDYYKRHYDSFRGKANRVLSIVTYLNPDWGSADGGELVLYLDDLDQEGVKVAPLYGTIALFLSEDFPHEVLPVTRDRYSIAGWFCLNKSIGNGINLSR